MPAYIAKRLLYLVPTLLFVLAGSFLLMRLIPGDPAALMLGPEASVTQIDALREEMGLNRSVVVQFWEYLSRTVTGDLGKSLYFRQPVLDVVLARCETSLLLALLSMLFVLLAGVPAGIVAGLKPNTWLDKGVLAFALLGASIPSFWLGLMLMLIVSVQLGWLPTSGFVSVLQTGNLANLRGLVLPSIVLGMANSALVARMTRTNLLEVMRADYITTARAKGLPDRIVILRHAMRNAGIPIVTVLGFTFAGLLSGTAVTETVFALPGIGRLLVDSVLARDYPLIQGVMVFVAIVYMVLNLLVDVSYSLLDPRVRYDAR